MKKERKKHTAFYVTLDSETDAARNWLTERGVNLSQLVRELFKNKKREIENSL